MIMEPKENLLVLVGPTASGKTKLAIELAKAINGEVISADSRYFYRELNIGTAKPSQQELAAVPHHLINITTLDEPWNLGMYQQYCIRLIAEINARNRLPILTGGTGQYIRAILQNWKIPPQAPSEELRKAIEAWGNEIGFDQLYKRLSWIDPPAAEHIDYRNKRRTIRALEVIFTSGQRFSNSRGENTSPYNALMLGLNLPREILYHRINQRIDQMISSGWIEEVMALKAEGKSEAMKKMGVIGYPELSGYLEGSLTLEEAIRLIRRNTRIYVRRQANWFKPTDAEINWFNAQDPDLLEQILDLVRSHFGITRD